MGVLLIGRTSPFGTIEQGIVATLEYQRAQVLNRLLQRRDECFEQFAVAHFRARIRTLERQDITRRKCLGHWYNPRPNDGAVGKM